MQVMDTVEDCGPAASGLMVPGLDHFISCYGAVDTVKSETESGFGFVQSLSVMTELTENCAELEMDQSQVFAAG